MTESAAEGPRDTTSNWVLDELALCKGGRREIIK